MPLLHPCILSLPTVSSSRQVLSAVPSLHFSILAYLILSNLTAILSYLSCLAATILSNLSSQNFSDSELSDAETKNKTYLVVNDNVEGRYVPNAQQTSQNQVLVFIFRYINLSITDPYPHSIASTLWRDTLSGRRGRWSQLVRHVEDTSSLFLILPQTLNQSFQGFLEVNQVLYIYILFS